MDCTDFAQCKSPESLLLMMVPGDSEAKERRTVQKTHLSMSLPSPRDPGLPSRPHPSGSLSSSRTGLLGVP